jgi:transposase
MTSHNPKIEVLSGPERRRRWSTAEKLAIIQETYEPDATVTIVARRYGIQPNQLFTWRKLASHGALTATAAQEDVVPASEYRSLQNQVKELQRLLGKKTMEGEILKEALEIATGPKKTSVALVVIAEGRFPMTAVCETLGVARSNMAERGKQPPSKARGRPPLADDELVMRSKRSSARCRPIDIVGFMRFYAVKPATRTSHGRTPRASIG